MLHQASQIVIAMFLPSACIVRACVVSYAYILHTSRWTLEAIGSLEPRLSALEDDFEEEKGEDDQIDGLEDGGHEKVHFFCY
ncbi:unnamed protein product [Ilex paraguariensis]|uniref:Uncharacterized protein n=1 Tax=Ilex paraguariensis TaxID=185542 RepID=A0ABC8U4D6_9AQUA